MPMLQDAVKDVFGPSGPLARSLTEFTPREGQTTMALAVAQTIEQGGVLVVEAGTGIGKTFAYLVPSLLCGKRVLVSTATKALQDQLFNRDLPRLMSTLAVPVRVALLKGRSSYLCVHRMESARQGEGISSASGMHTLAQIEAWSVHTRTGDLAEMGSLDESSSLLPFVTSTRENCLGSRCPKFSMCHVNAARRTALAADLVVVNHHLFFADLNVRESGVAELLPSVDVVVFDEAHQLNEIGVQFLGCQLSTGQLTDYCRDLLVQTAQWARGVANWQLLALDVGHAIREMRRVCGAGSSVERKRWAGDAPAGISTDVWLGAMRDLQAAVTRCQTALSAVAQSSPDLAALHARTFILTEKLDLFLQPVAPGFVHWLDVGPQVKWVESPLDIANNMRTRVLGDATQGMQKGHRSWVFTSATMGGDASMAWFVESCGLDGAQVLQVDSPFDYMRQAALYIPEDFPKPSDPDHAASVTMLVAHAAEVLGGRTLVLTTTLRSMRAIGDALAQYFAPSCMNVLVQGHASKRELLARFAMGGETQAGCILVASASFWEGVDIPGKALQLLVIDKLPFAPPSDPLVEAKVHQLESEGKNPFKHFHLPQATIALKQGAGRLIRSAADRGVLVVCDIRLAKMGYGKKMIAALPAMPIIHTAEQFNHALIALTKPSTMDQ